MTYKGPLRPERGREVRALPSVVMAKGRDQSAVASRARISVIRHLASDGMAE